jgi:putative peptidoglycan lipid II flippase
MTGAIIRLLNRKFSTISQAAILLAVFTFGSQLLGLVRDRMLAGKIGPGDILDVYNAAFKVPDLVFAIAASLVSVTILIPYLVDKLDGEDKERAKAFLNSVFSVFFVFIISVSVIIFFLMPVLAPLVAPGFSPEKLENLILVSRIMLASPILLGFSNLFGVITQTYKKFIVYALAPILYNIGLIIGIVFFYPAWGIVGLAIGVVIGAFLHFAIQTPIAFTEKMIPRPTRNINWKEIWGIVSVSFPRTFALAVNQILFTVLIAIASTMAVGSISIFQFAYVLQSVPFALIGMSYSVAAFPSLVGYFKEGNMVKFLESIITPMRHIIFWSIPITFLFIVLRAQIVRVVLGTGEFGWTDTRLTAAALALFVLSIAAQGVVALLVRAYYAAGITYRPLIHNLISAFLVIILVYIFREYIPMIPGVIPYFQELMRIPASVDIEVLFLPLAYSIGLLINAVILWVSFARRFKAKAGKELGRMFNESLLGSLVLGVVSFYMLRLLDNVFDVNVFWGIFLQGAIAGVIGIIAGVSVLYFIGNKEVHQIISVIRSKFWKSKILLE